jgi:hypothetical protein
MYNINLIRSKSHCECLFGEFLIQTLLKNELQARQILCPSVQILLLKVIFFGQIDPPVLDFTHVQKYLGESFI